MEAVLIKDVSNDLTFDMSSEVLWYTFIPD